MSALSLKQSSRGNIAISFNNNEPKSSNRNNIKNDKTASKLSSALSNKQQSMQITFQKTGQKLKKNLSKQFQTFNINYQDKITNKQSGKSGNKNINNEKMTKSNTQTQLTTQAKSPLMKSNLSSKTKLSQYKQKYEKSEVKQKNKEPLKNSREKSNRSKSPLSQNQSRSRKSSPQVSPSYSKKSISSFKRVLSKGKLQKINKNLEGNQSQNHIMQKSSFLKEKNTTQRKSKTQRNDFQINFPHLITQSQSVYPSSSYPNTGPNTGKQSQNHQNLNFSKQSNKMYIQEEQQSQFMQNQETQEDYISEGMQQNDTNLGISQTYESKQIQTHILQKDKLSNGNGYQQLPLSYITAMEILQKKIQQHEKTINKLQKQIKTKDSQYLKLQNHVKQLQTELDHKQAIITQKEGQIKFLKGYLNQEKINNRQALKEIAKNVYERTVSAKKDHKAKKNQVQQMNTSTRKQRRKLFQNSPNEQNQQNTQFQKNQIKQRPDFIEKLIAPQLQQKKLLQESQQRQRKLKQQLQKQQLIKDDIMRQQILRQQALKKQIQQKKRYQYLQHIEQEDYNEQSDRLQRGHQLGGSRYKMNRDTEMKRHYKEQDQYSSGMKRVRSISTAIKPAFQQRQIIGQTTYRPRNISLNQAPVYFADHSIHGKSSYQKTPMKRQQLKDPVLEKYIQAKSQLSSSHPYSYAYNNILPHTKNKQINNQLYQGSQLKSEKKNRDTVSKMRQLMRAQKQLIALNYKLQAFEKKILNTVQSTSSHDQSSQRIKSQQQKQTENILLEQLQKQYSMIKKQFEKKQLQVKQLKMKLQAEG